MNAFAKYFKFSEMEATLKDWSEKHPEICELRTIGKSFEGRPIYLLVLTDRSTGKDTDKPAFWADANIHSTEVAGTTTVLTLANQLIQGFVRSDPRARRLLADHVLYLVPRLNPDGAERALSHPPEFWRSGVRDYPFTDLAPGLHMKDMNGDGKILQIRIEDPAGDWKISSLNPKLLEKRAPHENGGKYYRLLPEGELKDYDGHLIPVARPRAGLDLNRNFPFSWRPEGEQKGAGPFPTSEPEVRAMVEFVTSHPNISVGLCYHTFGGLLLRVYDDRPDDKMFSEDVWVFDRLAEQGVHHTGYDAGSVGELLKYHPRDVITGTGSEWLYDQLGIFSWTVEIWNVMKRSGVEYKKLMEWYRSHPHTDDVKIHEWLSQNSKQKTYYDWVPFDHPQLGKVELGGWDLLFSWRNPPLEWIAEEAEHNAQWAMDLIETLPKLRFHEMKVEALAPDQHRILAVIENTGFLPTYTSKQTESKKAIRPIRALFEVAAGVELLSGEKEKELGQLEGRSNKLVMSGFSPLASPTDNRLKIEWVVRAKKGSTAKIRILSDRAGSLEREIRF